MKVCTECGVEKSQDEFHLKAGGRQGHRAVCKVCTRSQNAEYRKGNYDKVRAVDRAWQEANRDKARANSRERYLRKRDVLIAQTIAWHRANPEVVREKSRRYYQKNRERLLQSGREWAAANRGKRNATLARYRAAKLSATPKWLTENDLAEIDSCYEKANTFRDLSRPLRCESPCRSRYSAASKGRLRTARTLELAHCPCFRQLV